MNWIFKITLFFTSWETKNCKYYQSDCSHLLSNPGFPTFIP